MRAREHLDTVLPGYTHLQRAQPVRLAHHWLAFVEMLARDAAALRGSARAASTRSPLGSGALAGTTLPLDRDATARALGFAAPSRNSMDAVALARRARSSSSRPARSRMVHLSRLAEELVLWSTAEFGFIELADAYSTGSSLMPQKKNPDVPELVRGKAGRAVGNLVALLTVVKGLPLTYNRDLQEDKEPVFDSARTLRDSLEVMAGAIATLRVNEARCARPPRTRCCSRPISPRRSCARACRSARRTRRSAGSSRHCVEKDADLRSLSRADLRAFHPAFPRRRGGAGLARARARGRDRCRAPRRAPRVAEALDAARGRARPRRAASSRRAS